MAITIYGKDGAVKAVLSPGDSSTQAKEIQGDNVLTLSFTLPEYVALDVDDMAEFLGETYRLAERYRPRQKSTLEWAYDLKLYGIESRIKNLLVLNDTDGAQEPVFTLTAPAREHAALVVRCINAGMGGGADWKVGEVSGTENIVIDYEGKYCDEALREIAEKTGAEYWFDGQTVNICRCERGEPLTLGYDNGLVSIDPGTARNVKFYTRLYPVGSRRNIDPSRYGYSRLQLPGGQKYVEVNAEKYGRVDHYETAAFADIYPRRTGTVSSVRSETRKGDDGKDFTIYYFKDSDLPFNPNDYEIAGLVKRVSFQEGSELAGLGNDDNGTYYFETNYNSSTGEFEIITIFPDDDTQLPNDTLVPKAGDRYILWNIRMPDEYYALAEQEFKDAVDAFNSEHAIDIAVFKAPTDHVWVEQTGADLYIGRRVRLESAEYFPESGYRDSRITKVTRKVNLPSQMDIEIGDALSRTAMDKVADSISSVMNYAKGLASMSALPDIIKTGDLTKLTDSNLLSALRTVAEIAERALSRKADDTAKGLITFLKGLVSEGLLKAKGGLEVGTFVNSMLAGMGAGVDDRGNAQVESIEVRTYMKVMELIFNRLSAVESDFVFSESGTVEKVEQTAPDTYVLTMRKRWDFDFHAFREHDVIYGSVNTLLADGSHFTSWFRPVSVNASANTLTVVTYPDPEVPAGKNFAPVKGMIINRRGNAVDKDRQSCWYISSREGCIMYLEGVTKPILEEPNYYLSLGRPKNLSLFNGLPINYDHPYLFARGAIIQDLLRVDYKGNPVYEIVDVGRWDPAASYIKGKDPDSGRYIQHQAWHAGCCWRCVVPAATVGLEPRYNNLEWACIVGDSSFTLAVTSSNGRFFRFGQECTQLGFVLRHGEMDISVDASQVEWTRESGLPGEDLLWNIEHSSSFMTVDITPADMPSNWHEARQVVFRVKVSILDGAAPQPKTFETTFSLKK